MIRLYILKNGAWKLFPESQKYKTHDAAYAKIIRSGDGHYMIQGKRGSTEYIKKGNSIKQQ